MKRNITLLAALLIAVGSLGFVVYKTPLASMAQAVAPAQSVETAAPPAPSGASTGVLAAMQASLEGIYTRVGPSVVSIRVVQKRAASQGPREQFQQGEGSGFVWDTAGHIVTNHHVVAGADRVTVIFSDGTTVPGKVVGSDPHSDLAVVKLDVPAETLHPVELADSTKVRVGQLAIAIGNPFGEHNTMTTGIVSGLGRSLPITTDVPQGPTYTIPDVIQTDAPINPGNSGGALLDDQGRVIGVTAAIESPVRASAGVGFAIPSAIVQRVVPTLIKTGRYEHSWMGISGTSLNPDLAKAMGLKADQRGALVVGLVPGSPSEKAGLRGSDRDLTIDGVPARVGGDVIVAMDGQPIKGFNDVVAYLARSTSVGQMVTLTVLRDGKEKMLKVTLAARPDRSAQ